MLEVLSLSFFPFRSSIKVLFFALFSVVKSESLPSFGLTKIFSPLVFYCNLSLVCLGESEHCDRSVGQQGRPHQQQNRDGRQLIIFSYSTQDPVL
jgi:hypothetical protein